MGESAQETIGPYKILSVISEGALGTVYRALQPSLNRDVAIKVLPEYVAKDGEFLERFRREVAVAASLQHPNIGTIYDVGQQGNLHYIVVQLLEGCSLAQAMQREGILPLARTAHIVGQVAAALDYAHERNVVHRDVRPSNIFVGPGDHTTLVDFGIAEALNGARLTHTGLTTGTPEYMSPEQIEGRPVDHCSDIYALGTVVYQMVTGQVPFTADTPAAALYAHVHTPPQPPSHVTPSVLAPLDAVVLKALAKQPADRYQSASEMAQDLATVVDQAESTMAEILYVRAKELMAAWDVDKAIATWEKLSLIRPQYKDSTNQLALARRRLEALLEYREIAQDVRRTRERVASFAGHNPGFPDTEGIVLSPEPQAQASVLNRATAAVSGAILVVVGLLVRLISASANESAIEWLNANVGESARDYARLYGSARERLGVGTGLAVAGGILILVCLVSFLRARKVRQSGSQPRRPSSPLLD